MPSRKRVNKGMKRMNSLTLPRDAALQGKLLSTSPGEHCTAKLVRRPFSRFANCFIIFIIIDKGGNSLLRHFECSLQIRSNLKISLLSQNQTNTKKSKDILILFIPLFTLLILSKIVCALWSY